jgi:hypothetical protein
MEIDINSVILAARVYARLRERFLIADMSSAKTEADGGEVIATIRGAILTYVDEVTGAKQR